MLHGTQKLLDRPQVTAVLHSLPQNTSSFPPKGIRAVVGLDLTFSIRGAARCPQVVEQSLHVGVEGRQCRDVSVERRQRRINAAIGTLALKERAADGCSVRRAVDRALA